MFREAKMRSNAVLIRSEYREYAQCQERKTKIEGGAMDGLVQGHNIFDEAQCKR